MRSHRLRDWAFLAALTALLLVLDQLSKHLVIQNLAVGQAWAPIPALERIFAITHVQNTGVAFGQLPGLGWLFMLVNIAVFFGLLLYYPRITAGRWQLRLAVALILAGDLGNVIDRLRTASRMTQEWGSLWAALPHAYVTDFLDFRIWPVFNVADLCIVTGVALMAFTLWQEERACLTTDTVTEEQ